jgi:hypothetical protein
MKTLLKFASKRLRGNHPKMRFIRFAVGAAYGNLELYGYMGVTSDVYQTIKEAIQQWRQKSAMVAMPK